jgi:predicted RNA-binding protein with PUA-like domain
MEMIMALWLFKQEPSCYSFADLERDGSTVWDGVTNALARRNLREVKPGDRVFFYHTGKEKAVVGEMKIASAPTSDPNSDDDKSVVVTVKAVRRLPRPVTLAEIKADKFLAKWDLVRLSRLSVVAVSAEQWQRVEELAAE